MIRFNSNKRVFEIYYANFVISSAYQEVRNELGHVHGYEALCRVRENGVEVAPNKLFRYLSSRSNYEMIELNMLIVDMHLKGFRYSNIYNSKSKIFININADFILNISKCERKLTNLVNLISVENVHLHQLVLEITENFFPIADLVEAYLSVNRLKDRGFLIGIDDFGTGYSDFSRVATLKPHYIKVSRELLLYSEIFMSDELRKLISLSKINYINLVYDGIEHLEQYEFAKNNGARLYQGYFLSKPIHHAIKKVSFYA